MTEEQANLPWSEDLIETEDSYGKYYSRHVLDAKGRAVCDMQNSDVAEIHEDWDENGCVRTDLVAAQHAALIVKAVNSHAALKAIIDEQAADGGLWFIPKSAAEAYLMQELRRLHAAFEGVTPYEAASRALLED